MIFRRPPETKVFVETRLVVLDCDGKECSWGEWPCAVKRRPSL